MLAKDYGINTTQCSFPPFIPFPFALFKPSATGSTIINFSLKNRVIMETLKNIPLSQVSEIQLSYNPIVKPSQRQKVTSSKEVYQLFLDNWDINKIEFVEQFKIMLLNRAQKVLGIVDISTGGVTGTVADPKVIFGAALKANACSIILSHNHPSGNLKPSQADISLTNKIKAGGNLLDISVLDHIVVTSEWYFSFADEGLI